MRLYTIQRITLGAFQIWRYQKMMFYSIKRRKENRWRSVQVRSHGKWSFVYPYFGPFYQKKEAIALGCWWVLSQTGKKEPNPENRGNSIKWKEPAPRKYCRKLLFSSRLRLYGKQWGNIGLEMRGKYLYLRYQLPLIILM